MRILSLRSLLFALAFCPVLFSGCRKSNAIDEYCGNFKFTVIDIQENAQANTTTRDTLVYYGTVKNAKHGQIMINFSDAVTTTNTNCYGKTIYIGSSCSPGLDPDTGEMDFTDYNCYSYDTYSGRFSDKDHLSFSETYAYAIGNKTTIVTGVRNF